MHILELLIFLKDSYLWINGSEHFTLNILQKDANLRQAFQKASLLIKNLSQNFKFEYSEKWGYLTMNPALLGTGLKIFVYIKLAYLGLEEIFREQLLEEYGLECFKGT